MGHSGIGVTPSAIRHSSGNSPERNKLRKSRLSFGARIEAVFWKKLREATRRVHTTIRIKIHQVPLYLTRSEGNPTECRSRMTGLRQLNNVSWLLTVKPRTQQLSLPHRIWNKRASRRTKRRNNWLCATEKRCTAYTNTVAVLHEHRCYMYV